MSLLVLAAIYIGSFLIGRLLQPHTPSTPKAVAEPFKLPTIDPSRPIAIVWGDVYLRDPGILWWGAFKSVRFQGAGIFVDQDLDYDVYYVAVQVGLCHGPVEGAPGIFWDDKPMIISPYFDNGSWWNLQGNRLLGTSGARSYMIPREMWINAGGLSPLGEQPEWDDVYYFYRGTQDQPADPVLALPAYKGAVEPRYFGLCHMVMWNVALGPSGNGAPSMQSLAVQLKRRPNQLGLIDGHQIIGTAANPACMLYELLTDPLWGLRKPPASIDITSFRAAGETLFAEGFRLSAAVTDQDDGDAIAAEICRHIDAVMYPDPSTALITLKLIRADYVAATLPVFDDSNVSNIEISRGTWLEMKNMVRVRYTGPRGTERIATETNLASVQLVGGLVPQDVTYQWIDDAATAQRVAARDLKTFGYPLARESLDVDRRAWNLSEGDVFKLTSAKHGVTGLICRVARISKGTLLDAKIHVDAVEDAFTADWTGNPATGSGLLGFFGNTTSVVGQVYVHKVGAGGTESWAAGGTLASINGGLDATNQAIISDGMGGLIIGWTDKRSGTFALYAQRYDSAGAALWAPGGLLMSTRVDGGTLNLQICSDGAGGAVFAWDGSPDAIRVHVYTQRISSAGAALWTANGFSLSTVSSQNQGIVAVDPDGSGGFLFVWQENSGVTPRIHAQRLDSLGAVLWGVGGITVTTTGTQTSPQIVADGSGGCFLSWDDSRGTGGDIYGQHLNASGVAQWTANGLPMVTASGSQKLGVFSTTASGSLNPRRLMLLDGSGGFFLAWSDNRSGTQAYAQRYDSSGTEQWAANGIPLGACDATFSCINLITDGGGGIIVTWADAVTSGPRRIYAQRLNASGVLQWDGTAKLLQTGASIGPVGIIAVPDGSGGMIVFWYAALTGTQYSVFGQQVSATGAELWGAGGLKVLGPVQTATNIRNNNLALALPDAMGPGSAEDLVGAASISVSATVAASPVTTVVGKAVLPAKATVAGLADGTHAAAAVISTTATVAGAGTYAHPGAAAITATALVAGAITGTRNGAAAISATATVAATGTV